MKTNDDLIQHLQQLLDQASSARTKRWWEQYLRHVIPFRGVGIPEIRTQLARWREATGVAAWPLERQLKLALQLFEPPVAEDKLAGILFLQNYLYDRLPWAMLIERYEQLYARNLIFDWSTCDWFGVRVLGPTIARHGRPCARAVAAWRDADDLWQARSSVVAFVPVAANTAFYSLILDSCAVVIRRDERFAKTAVGWMLREMSKHDGPRVLAFLDANLQWFSLEALRNALKYFEKAAQGRYLRQYTPRASISRRGPHGQHR
jgi:3-methyladenine DNA glycosylase AlkD